MRCRKFADYDDALKSVSASKYDVGLTVKDGKPTIIFHGDVCGKIMDYVVKTLRHQFNYTDLRVEGRKLYESIVHSDPDDVIKALDP